MLLKKYLKTKKYIGIPLQINATNHFELQVKINKVPSRFILDTGASNTCIDIKHASYFKLFPQDTPIKASGAGATDIKAHLANQVKIKIGKWKSKKNEVVLIDLSHVNKALEMNNLPPVEGIIGADILQKADAIIDYKSKKLFLKQ